MFPIIGKLVFVYSINCLILFCPAALLAQLLNDFPNLSNQLADHWYKGPNCVNTFTSPSPKCPAALNSLLNTDTPVVLSILKNFLATALVLVHLSNEELAFSTPLATPAKNGVNDFNADFIAFKPLAIDWKILLALLLTMSCHCVLTPSNALSYALVCFVALIVPSLSILIAVIAIPA